MVGRRAHRRLRYEVHVPISPTPAFFAQVRLLAASIRRNAGDLADARVIVTVGSEVPPFDIGGSEPWAERYGVEWRWMDAERFARFGYWGTAAERFTYAFDADFVLLLDADTLCTGPLDDLPRLARNGLAGLIAHLAPVAAGRPCYVDDDGREDASFWDGLYTAAGLGTPALRCRHSGWGIIDDDPARRDCPPYFNLGVLAGTRDVVTTIGRRIYAELEAVDRFVDSVFRCQLAVTLALERTGTPWRELPLRFNFPNDEGFARAHPTEAAQARIMHYLRTDEIDRSALAMSAAQLDAFLARRDLSPTNTRLRDHLAALRDDVFSSLTGSALSG